MKLHHALVGAAGLAIAMSASAGSVDMDGDGGGLPPVGTGGSGTDDDIFCSTITVTDDFEISDITVTLNDLTHTWAGDLIITLEHVDTGTEVDLVHRVGRTGDSGFGDSSDYGADYSFNDAFTGDLWAEAAATGAGVIAGGNYFPTTVDGGASSLSDFDGESSAGDWKLTISDNASGDSGALRSWTLSLRGDMQMEMIPLPSGVGLGAAGLCGVFAVRRRRDD